MTQSVQQVPDAALKPSPEEQELVVEAEAVRGA
jgi:hypothetical protein